MNTSENLRIAVQSKGRMSDDSVELLRETGLRFDSPNGNYIATCKNAPVEIVYLRDDDIPTAVQDGVTELGIVGQNEVVETRARVEEVLPLGFAPCKVCIAAPADKPISNPSELQGLRIATSYRNILEDYLKKIGVEASIVPWCGSVEVTPKLGVSDVIADLVSSGGTLKRNNLVQSLELMQSEAVLIATPNDVRQGRFQDELRRIVNRISAVLDARGKSYLMFNIPATFISRVLELLPDSANPDVVSTTNSEVLAVQVVISDEEFWKISEQLLECGASAILQTPIQRYIS